MNRVRFCEALFTTLTHKPSCTYLFQIFPCILNARFKIFTSSADFGKGCSSSALFASKISHSFFTNRNGWVERNLGLFRNFNAISEITQICFTFRVSPIIHRSVAGMHAMMSPCWPPKLSITSGSKITEAANGPLGRKSRKIGTLAYM